MDFKAINVKTGKSLKVELADEVFAQTFNEPLVHQVLVAEQNRLRAGTKAQKNRSAVRGGGAKPWRQKGTGRARAGTSRSPIWRTGGVTFAATPRNFSQKVNRKMVKKALSSLLSELLRQQSVVICEELSLEAPKTKEFVASMKSLKVDDALIVTKEMDENLYLASRNLYNFAVTEVDQLGILGLLQYKKVVISREALTQLQEKYTELLS